MAKRRRKPKGGRGADAPTAAVVHLGCAKNQVDTERLMGALASKGFTLSGEVEEADVVLLTTCAFVAEAVSETEDVIENLLALKEGKGAPLVAVAGCLTDRFGAAELAGRFPGVDLWVSGKDYLEVPEMLGALLSGKRPGHGVEEGRIPPEFERGPRLPSTSRYAYLKVAEGCSNRCSYCTIPLIRGDYCGVPASLLVREARSLARMGVRELVLVAQDAARYEDPESGEGLPHLVERLSGIEGIGWIRLMYLHPAHIEQALEAFTVSAKVLPYADVPVQHASDRVLDAMGRGYGGADLRRVVERLRGLRSGMVLRTTVMVGHPGEGEEEFRELMGFMREAGFLHAGAFTYSAEAGTPSAGMPGAADAETAARRLEELMLQQQEITFRLLEGYMGGEIDVISEDGDARAWFQAPEVDGMVLMDTLPPEGMSRARITGRSGYDLVGEPV